MACRASSDTFDAFHDEGAKLGIQFHDLWTRDTLNDKLILNENARMAAFYFGDGPAIEGTVPIPLALDRSSGRDLLLLERDEAAKIVREWAGDLIISGRPGVGKTRLAMEGENVRFLTPGADANAVAESLRQRQPARVVIDDAGLAIERLEMLLELQREGHDFRIVATTWTENVPEVRKRLPDATVVELGLLERQVVDELLKELGVSNYYLRFQILDQAGGRPGWAVALTELAKRGEGTAVLSGRGLIGEVEPYLRRLGASSDKALGLLSVIAALGRVTIDAELPDVEAYLGVGRLDGQQLLQELAAAGVLDSDGKTLAVAPNALRFALVGFWFFEQQPAPWPIDEVVERWPSHRSDILAGILEAAWTGSAKARTHIETLLPTVIDVPYGMLDKYIGLDPAAAERAIGEIDSNPDVARLKVEILEQAAKRFALPSAIPRLLDMAVGDDRAEHSYPNHPIRVLGEAGNRVSPHGETSFDARSVVLENATKWLEADPSTERELIWARVVAHLLEPDVAGNYQDSGSPMKFTMQAGWETPEHLDAIASELWPPIAARLDSLDGRSLVALVDVLDNWIRLERRLEGAFGAKPSPEQSASARAFLDLLLPALRNACEGKPAAQMALRDTTRMFRVGLKQNIDPEFRLLSWPWRLYRPGHMGPMQRAVSRLVDCWAAEDPADLMTRLAGWTAEAARRGKNLDPWLQIALEALSERVENVDPLIEAGLAAGLSWELNFLYRASVARSEGVPSWFSATLTGGARWAVIQAALNPASPNTVAAREALAALGDADARLVETIVIQHGHVGHGWVSRELLRHAEAAVRGEASLWFGIAPGDHAAALPEDWYADWAVAFADAPLQSARGNNYRLGEILTGLVSRDPDLVERWFTAQIAANPERALFDLPDQASASFPRLPQPNRDRLMRAVQGRWNDWEMLAVLLGSDMEWLSSLLDEGVVGTDDVTMTLNHGDPEVDDRVKRLLMFAPVLVPRGVDARAVASRADLGGWTGERSDHYERIRQAFADSPESEDQSVQAVIAAGIEIYERARDQARREEHERRVTGEL